MSPSNIFKRNKKTTLPKTSKVPKAKKVVAKAKPATKGAAVKRTARKKTIVKKQADKPAEASVEPVENKVVAKRAKDSAPAEEVIVPTQETAEKTQIPAAEVSNDIHAQEEPQAVSQEKQKTIDQNEEQASDVQAENVLVQEEQETKPAESTTQQEEPAPAEKSKESEKAASIVRKKQTITTLSQIKQ